MAHPGRIHDVRPRSGLDRWLFTAAFLTGAAGGVALKLTEAPLFIATTFPAAVLLGYAAATLATGRLRLDPEPIGDNCYYLGFLFTLASLATTLYQVAAPGIGQTQADALPGVISGFGVALISTIFGVFLRVLMMQMRPDFVAEENQVRAELKMATREFRTQLTHATRDLKSFAVQSIQHASERDAKLRDSTEQLISDSHAQLLKAQNDLSGSFDKSCETFEKSRVDLLAEHIKLSNKAAEDAAENIARSFEKSLGGLKEPVEVLGGRLETIAKRLKYLEDRIAAADEKISGFANNLDDVQGQASKILSGINGSVTDADINFRKLSAGLSRTATRIENKTLPALSALEERLSDQLRPQEPDGKDGGYGQQTITAAINSNKAGPWG